ncbi:MAG: hypothetical protein KDJ22_00320 [Candidatus Competibacteraceae bacterium]|nr:hypothetical protein [Candidatus Competibacteraceae bacterium]
MNHQGKRRLHVDPGGDWKQHTDALPAGCLALGTVMLGTETGALIFNERTQDYALLNDRGRLALNARKVQAALRNARPETTADFHAPGSPSS